MNIEQLTSENNKLKSIINESILDKCKNIKQLQLLNIENAKLRSNLKLNLCLMLLLAGCLVAVIIK